MRYVNKSITEAEETFILHGCNTKGGFGNGVAGALSTRWPSLKEDFKRLHKIHLPTLGEYTICRVSDETSKHDIVNLYTQNNYGKDGAKYASYLAIVDSIRSFFNNSKILILSGYKAFAISRIGCNLGGLKWELVEELLKELEQEFDVEFVVYG